MRDSARFLRKQAVNAHKRAVFCIGKLWETPSGQPAFPVIPGLCGQKVGGQGETLPSSCHGCLVSMSAAGQVEKRDFIMKALKLLAVLFGLVAISACSEEADKSAEQPPASTEQPASE